MVSTPGTFIILLLTSEVGWDGLTETYVIALVSCGSLTSTVKRLITPSVIRFETLLLTAASERPTRPAISTYDSRASSRRMPRIASSVLSDLLHLLYR